MTLKNSFKAQPWLIKILSGFLMVAIGGWTQFAAANLDPDNWVGVLRLAKKQRLTLHTNDDDKDVMRFIRWAAAKAQERFEMDVQINNASNLKESISELMEDKENGISVGRIDLLWLRGNEVAPLMHNQLLFGGWSDKIPNYALTAPSKNPSVHIADGLDVTGFMAPFSHQSAFFVSDQSVVLKAPESMRALLTWVRRNPGLFTYPHPETELGMLFLKQAFLQLTSNHQSLLSPPEAGFWRSTSRVLWNYLNQIHPYLHNRGKLFPANEQVYLKLYQEANIALAFFKNAAMFKKELDNASMLNAQFTPLRKTTTGYVDFMAIPFNAGSKAAAMVFSNLLLSAESQAKKMEADFGGLPSVLYHPELRSQNRLPFSAVSPAKGLLPPSKNRVPYLLPHPQWGERLLQEWRRRYEKEAAIP